MHNHIISAERKNYLRKLKTEKTLIKFLQIALLLSFFFIWEIMANIKIIDSFIFSQPTRIIKSAIEMFDSGEFFRHVFVTVGETVLGFIISTVIGVVFAILLWWNGVLMRVLDPYLVVLNSLPKTALAPIIIVIFGTSIKSIVITSVLTSVVVTILTVLAGFLDVSCDKVKLIYTFGGTKTQVLTKVVLPQSLPFIFNALKINVGLSFVGVIVGEFLVAKEGLGYLIVYGSQVFKMDWVMLSVITLCILSALFYKILNFISNKFSKGHF